MQFILLVVLIIALSAQLAQAKKMWGSRKKREAADDIVLPSIPKTAHDVVNRRSGAGSTRKSFGASKGTGSGRSDGMEDMLNMYVKMFEDLLDSDEFESSVNPETIKAMIEQFPGASSTPEIATLLNSPEMSDPALLRKSMRDGLLFIKSSLGDIIALLSDPERLSEVIAQLPAEVKPLVEALQSGDVNALKDFVINMPGLEHAQKKLFLALLDGNTDLLTRELEQMLGDKNKIEAARQHLLASPELAEAFGLPMEVVSDPEQWAAVIDSGAEALKSGAGMEEEEEEEISTEEFVKRRFSKLNRERAA